VSIDRKAAWQAYVRRLYDVGVQIVAEADKMTVGADVRDPKVLALALLSRTLSNFNGAAMMIEAGLIVEARTLTRCCFENLLWLAELAARRAEFVEEMVRDDVASQQGRGKMALSWSERLEESAPYEKGLRERLERLKEKYPKSKPIKFSDLGQESGVDQSYMWYRLLSADAAHPSLTSLARYFERQPDNVLMLSMLPAAKLKEEDTLQFASQALLGVCVATCEICTVPKSHALLSSFFDEFIELARRASWRRMRVGKPRHDADYSRRLGRPACGRSAANSSDQCPRGNSAGQRACLGHQRIAVTRHRLLDDLGR
jgi:hypothetical protein